MTNAGRQCRVRHSSLGLRHSFVIRHWSFVIPMSYWQSTRHPGPCLLFVGPLLLAYELGVSSLGGSQAASLRNGADVWLREGLAAVGLAHPFAAPGLVVLILAVWFWWQRDSIPEDAPGLCLGMALE